jgi:hypothetical protein
VEIRLFGFQRGVIVAVVDGLGGPVGDPRLVPRGDVCEPAAQRPAERLHLGRARLVLEVEAELGDEVPGDVGVTDVVDVPDGLLGVPGGADLASGVIGGEQAAQLGVAAVVEALMCLREQPSGAVERVVFAAAVAEGLGLDGGTRPASSWRA